MDLSLERLIKEEDKFWSKIFNKEIVAGNKRMFSSYWWEEYYSEITFYIKILLQKQKKPRILEAGSGSGKASILLGKNIDRTLLDISTKALEFAKLEAEKFKARGITYVQGNIFSMPFKNDTFDLAWNIGVIEHYSKKSALKAIIEMVRVTKNKGYIAFGVPNYNSGPVIKARILKNPLFKLIPGYRFHSEKRYNEGELEEILKHAAQINNKQITNFNIMYFGNSMPMEAPKFFILTVGKMIGSFFPKSKFLILVSARLVNVD